MTRIKLCGLSRLCDIEEANALRPDYIGFVFAPESRRYVMPRQAAELKGLLSPEIAAVGVFVGEAPETVAELLNSGVIDAAQLHGEENSGYIRQLRQLTDRPLVQAFRIRTARDAELAGASTADYGPKDAQAVFSRGGTECGKCGRRSKAPQALCGGRQLRDRNGWAEGPQ